MNCSLHLLPNDHIGLLRQLPIICCKTCASIHTDIQSFVIFNQPALQLFIQITSIVIKKIRQWIGSIQRQGYQSIFQVVNPDRLSINSFQLYYQINLIAKELLSGLKELLKANRQYVKANKTIYQNLLNQNLLKDLYQLISIKRYVQMQKLSRQMSIKLAQKYPQRPQYKKISFEILKIHEDWIRQIIQNGMRGKEDQLIVTYQIKKTIKIQKKNSNCQNLQKLLEDNLLYQLSPQIIRQVDSFQEIFSEDNKENPTTDITDNSKTPQSIYKNNLILTEIYESEDILGKNRMEKVLEQNSRLTMENLQLRQQNKNLHEKLKLYENLYGRLNLN